MSEHRQARRAIRGSARLTQPLSQCGITAGTPADGVIYDAAEVVPESWSQVERILVDVFELAQAAMANGASTTYVLDEPSLHGHDSELRCALATGLLGGARSLAVEGRRDGIVANAVSVGRDDDPADLARAVAWIATQERLTGQLVACGDAHVGRPAT